MDDMARIQSKRRVLRGLAMHHRLHPSEHPRRLVTRTQDWDESPVPGRCRWCGKLTATISLTWHPGCLAAFLVASGQKPTGLQMAMCSRCGGRATELDHRLAINVARALGPDALKRAFTIENLHWMCRECHRRKTRVDRKLAAFIRACQMDWRRALRVCRLNRAWTLAFLGDLGLAPTGLYPTP